MIDGSPVFRGELPAAAGPLGLFLEPGTHVEVDRFAVAGEPLPAAHTWLWSEALSGAGANEADWSPARSPRYRFGAGAVSRKPGERVKWNFRGRGFRLWLPRGPGYGRAAAILDGAPVGDIDLGAATEEASRIVLSRDDLEDGFHALALRGTAGLLPVDCLDALQ